MDFPRAVRFSVPLDKGNDCSGDEIGCYSDDVIAIEVKKYKVPSQISRISFGKIP